VLLQAWQLGAPAGCLFNVDMGSCPSPFLRWRSSHPGTPAGCLPNVWSGGGCPSSFSCSCTLKAPHPLCCMSFSISSLLFSFVCFPFCWAGVSLSGGHAGLSQGWLWEYRAAYLLTCWFVSPKQVWSWWHLAVWKPSCFLNVMGHGEAVYELGVQDV
jgi:hypothetical protein